MQYPLGRYSDYSGLYEDDEEKKMNELPEKITDALRIEASISLADEARLLNAAADKIADQQAIIERQKQQIEYWQQLCREKGVEIIDKSPLADQQTEIAKLQADVEYYKGVADGYEQILEK